MIFLRNSQAYTWTLIYTNDHNLTLYSNRQRFTNDDCVIFMSGSEHDFFRDVIHFCTVSINSLIAVVVAAAATITIERITTLISSSVRLTTF
jgi:hypothetical protein